LQIVKGIEMRLQKHFLDLKLLSLFKMLFL
jgi:hypothetical protein